MAVPIFRSAPPLPAGARVLHYIVSGERGWAWFTIVKVTSLL